MRTIIPLFGLAAAVIWGIWAWLGHPVAMPQAPLASGEKLYCVSYAPYRDAQSPLDASTRIPASQIEADFVQLSKLTDCVRTYSVDFGLELVPEIAARHGLKVMQGLWLGGEGAKNAFQIETAIELAKKYPNVIRAVVVGNEVLLRGEMTANDLAGIIRAVKARVSVPVTYADVWEYWLRNRVVADAVDFITIHILPYWEDFPIPARFAAAHVDSIRRQVAESFRGKDILIGEVGWPSAGRMREGALPSLSNQAQVISGVLALSKRDNVHVNVIEAFDQPWKRMLEGTVGGHWGLIGGTARELKFALGEPVSDHPHWRIQAAGGIVFAALIFVAGYFPRRGGGLVPWLAVTAMAITGGLALGSAAVTMPVESFGPGGWLRALAFAAVALTAPPLCAAALMSNRKLPAFAQIIGRLQWPRLENVGAALGVVLIGATVLAIIVALGLAFDPRYRDFPYAALGATAVPLFLLAIFTSRATGARGAAEIAAAGLLALCTGYIVLNESFANWQSLLVCGELLLLAFSLTRVRGAPG
jgi:exo-beta-1,3-glucanase (GH17 family)